MPPPIKKLADRFLSNPKYIEVARPASANLNITAHKVYVRSRNKREVLRELLRTDEVTSALIFANRKTTVRELNKNLRQNGFRSGEIHGDMDQSSRIAELDRFKSGEVNILVASDVAARGLDVKGVSHVFNFDTPWHPDDYVHRIGRTGRAGAKGRAFTLVTPGRRRGDRQRREAHRSADRGARAGRCEAAARTRSQTRTRSQAPARRAPRRRSQAQARRAPRGASQGGA
jgi:superfamily II DNA/RNA helicase